MREQATNIINEELKKNGIKTIKIILFGSRAREDYREDSDWDFLIVIDKELSFDDLKRISGNIQWRLAECKIPNDIIIRSQQQFENSKNFVGNISYYAQREGVIL